AVALVDPDGTVTWSDPVTFAGTSLVSLSAAATDWAQGDELTVSYTVSGGTAPYTVQLLVGNGPGSLSRAARTTLAAPGSGTLVATGLTPGLVYYWQVVVTDAGGATAASDDSASVTMPAGAVYLNKNTGISWSLDQRTATLNGALQTLGAGDNWALLYATDHLYDRWPNDIRSFRGSTTNTEQKVRLTETGAFSITQTYQWGEEIGFNWIVSNSNGRTTWFTTRQPDYDGNDAASRAHFWVGDFQTYAWKGGEGLWTDTEKWEPDGTMEGHDQAGLPITGSYFTFPAGETSVVTIPAGASLLKPVSFEVPAGADVTLKSDSGVADFGLWRTDSPSRRQRIYVREGASLTISGLKGRWGPQDNNGGGIELTAKNASLVFKDGSDIDLGWDYGQWGLGDWSNGRVGGGIRIEGGSKLYLRGVWGMAGPNEYVIDDSQVTMAPGDRDSTRVQFALTDGGRFVFRGAHPLLVCNNRFYADRGGNPKGAALQYVDFEIPATGFAEAPLQSKPSCTYTLGWDGSASYQMVFRVPTNSPIATAKGVFDQPLIWWPAGKEAWMLTENQYLPNPDTDYWYETTDALTGEFTGWGVHIVGRPAVEEPQIVGLAVTNVVAGAADLFFYGIPGTNAASATFSVAIERTDDPTDTSAALAMVPASGTVTAGTRFALAATGLAEGGSYRITVSGVDGTDATLACTETIDFDALADYAAASTTSAGATTAQDGPYTVWTFTDTESEGVFTVTRAGTARILVVGGGGSGGGADT
ncbi:MAG: hypothetical protein IJV65_03170, partial [Kiritimatiellae bacterium]|nr:hypothetical protein [Kiritimatiellia bacterium]